MEVIEHNWDISKKLSVLFIYLLIHHLIVLSV